ncbi:hypothetical protein BOX15_Mlig010587g1 [Macrostomum lignano]|uniref:Uncharacterized protein n=1 Tax=Macrostomum lignano TaxID=282301 RepID=A0A267H809_9PLAT|nr:hypothetical protein BOX15_Mlig010587g1 [Macrostomum lignano]
MLDNATQYVTNPNPIPIFTTNQVHNRTNSSYHCPNGSTLINSTCNAVSKPFLANATTQILNFVSSNKKTLLNSAIVLCVLTSIVVIFFIIKAIRLKRAARRSKRYGLVDADKLEMQRLGDEDDDDDEDITVFDVNGSQQARDRGSAGR